MSIRVLMELDAKQFWYIRLRALRENPEAFGASYEEEINAPIDSLIFRFNKDLIVPVKENFILGAFNTDNDIVGIVGFRRETRVKLRHKSSIWGMYVVPELRQTGFGKSLLSELLIKANRLEGIEQVSLSVVSSNINAKVLYASAGFKTYGIEKRALKIGKQYFDEDLMALFMN